MARKPRPDTDKRRSPNMEAALLALADGKCHRLADLAAVTGIAAHPGLQQAMARLVTRRLAIRKEAGCYKATAAGRSLLAAPGGPVIVAGKSGPRTQDGPYQPRRRTMRDKYWAAMRAAGKFTAACLVARAAPAGETVATDDARRYCKALAKAGYLLALKAPANGPFRWSLVRDSGPMAPVERVQRQQIYDRNDGTTRPIGPLGWALAAVDVHPRGIAGVAERIGYSRSALSSYVAGKYPAKTKAALEAAILQHLANLEERP
ncbi:MAG: hypothetical protein H7841_08430 [Magnetospirillum sp. WYHS-4]